MIRIALVGDIGSGKSFISRLFSYPVFNADKVVSNIYSKNKKIYLKLKKKLPKFFFNFPVEKETLINAILENNRNIKVISSIVHPEVRKKLNFFLKKNKKEKVVILDIPLYLENKINKKNDIIIFIESNRNEILKRIKKRKNFNNKILQKLRHLQLPNKFKKKKSNYVIKNTFNKNLARKKVRFILKKILSWKK